MARPMPEPPPVTTATFLLRLNTVSHAWKYYFAAAVNDCYYFNGKAIHCAPFPVFCSIAGFWAKQMSGKAREGCQAERRLWISTVSSPRCSRSHRRSTMGYVAAMGSASSAPMTPASCPPIATAMSTASFDTCSSRP